MTEAFLGRFRHRDGVTKVCEPVRDDWSAENPEPASNSEICQMSPERYREWKMSGKKPVMDDDPIQEFEPVADTSCKAAEEFSRASDRKNNIDNGRPSEAELSKMSPAARFVACSDARNRVNPNYKRDAIRRRRD